VRQVCRSSRGYCDFEEKCDGIVADCPPDGVRVPPPSLTRVIEACSLASQRTGDYCAPNGTCHRGQCVPSAAQQQETVCRSLYGRAAGSCKSVCGVIWCADTGGCITYYDYFVAGTACSAGMVCDDSRQCSNTTVFAVGVQL
jgi:hypothetical protein